jgi:enamine deaminase RidA (YjgF/YER057c/UK114 family)
LVQLNHRLALGADPSDETRRRSNLAIAFRSPDGIHPPLGGYSHQVEVSGSQRWLVMAGQVGRTLDGTVPSDPIEQIEIALENVRINLEGAGMEVKDLVKLTWYLVGEIDSAKRRQITAAWLGGHQPCSTLLYVAGLAAPEYKVEIDSWACR